MFDLPRGHTLPDEVAFAVLKVRDALIEATNAKNGADARTHEYMTNDTLRDRPMRELAETREWQRMRKANDDLGTARTALALVLEAWAMGKSLASFEGAR